MSDRPQTKETTQEDVDLITELFQDLISDIVDLKPYTTNVSLLQNLEMKHSSDSKPPIDTAIRTLPRISVSDKKVNTESNLEKTEEYPEIEFESQSKTYKNIKINANKAAVQRLENSRKNIGDVIDPEHKYTTVYSIDANSFGKTKYHTILSIAPKETSKNSLRQSENNDSKAITDNLKKNIEKNGYQCFQVVSSAVMKPTDAGKNKQSKPFKAKDINTTRVVSKNEETDKHSQASKFKMNTLNSSELSERIKYLAKRINLNRLNKRMKIEKNCVDHPKPKPKTKTPLTMPSLITSKQQHQKNTKLSQPITKTAQPKLQVSTVGRPISPNWMTKQNREKYSKNTHPKNKNNDHTTQKFDDNLKRKREVDFVAKRIVIQPASKSNFNDTCHLKLVLAEMDKRKSDSKQFINSTVAEQLRNIFKNIKDRKTSPKILVKPPKISNEYEKEKLMNSIPGILNEILQQNSSTSLIKNNLECSNQTSKKNNKLKNRFRKHDIPIQVEVMKQIRTMNELRSSYTNEHKEREGKYINSETKLLNSIKPEDILPISAEYSKQKKLKSVSKSAASLLSIGPNDMNVLTKKAHKMRDDIDTNELDTPSPRKIHKHKVSILKFNDILKLKRLSNTLANYFRRSNRSFETIIPLTVQCLYNKGKVLTKHQYSLWKQYNAKNCVVPNKTGDNNTFVRPYTPLIEIPLKSAQKLPSSTCIRRKSYCNMGRQSHSNIMQQSHFKDRFGTTNISSQESDASDDDARVRRSNSYSTRSNSTSVYSDKSLSSSHHISGKGKEETVLKVINAEMDDSTLKGDPTLGGILGLSVHNLKDNNDIHYFRPTVEKEPNDWLFRKYPAMNGRKVYTKPMMRRLYDQKNIRRSCTVEDCIDLKSTLVC
ncbi:uncharacterized protein LOC123290387 [Chrysoperla carnea]|uniref:uncharacterized protein LOC123290387 n=1 Tax=Chrysoperla carnea TaxID=189513 RepID=UPI001D05DCFA|nr:uncharacterized protein LOC123290387 [Chrysoperla carnea]